jgi:hypothetical protein
LVSAFNKASASAFGKTSVSSLGENIRHYLFTISVSAFEENRCAMGPWWVPMESGLHF